jgi:hypothetical protein
MKQFCKYIFVGSIHAEDIHCYKVAITKVNSVTSHSCNEIALTLCVCVCVCVLHKIFGSCLVFLDLDLPNVDMQLEEMVVAIRGKFNQPRILKYIKSLMN